MVLKSGLELRDFLDQMKRYEDEHKQKKEPEPPHLVLAISGGKSYQNAEVFVLMRDALFLELVAKAKQYDNCPHPSTN
jgi:hypothetical protein